MNEFFDLYTCCTKRSTSVVLRARTLGRARSERKKDRSVGRSALSASSPLRFSVGPSSVRPFARYFPSLSPPIRPSVRSAQGSERTSLRPSVRTYIELVVVCVRASLSLRGSIRLNVTKVADGRTVIAAARRPKEVSVRILLEEERRSSVGSFGLSGSLIDTTNAR